MTPNFHQQFLRALMLSSAGLIAATAFAVSAGPASACDGVGCVGQTIVHGAEKTGSAIGAGAEKAGGMVVKGAKGAGVAVEKGVDATGHALGDAGHDADKALTGK